MPPSNLLRCLLLTSSLILLTLQGSISYVKSASSPNMRSSFQLPSLSAGSIITAYINQNGGNSAFSVELWNSFDTFPSDSSLQSAQLSGSATYTSRPLANSGTFRLEILPSSTPFPFHIRIQVNNITVGIYSDVARYDKIFPIFNSGMGRYIVSASAQRPGPNATLSLSVFGPFESLRISGGSQIASSSIGSGSITYSSSGNQYFYVVVKASPELQLSKQFITVRYQTDIYECPYDPDYPDHNSVYLGCSNEMPTVGYPCSNYDAYIQKCIHCYQPFVANTAGVCVQSTNCPPKQYYQYGQCYDVIEKCDDFQFFGGLCNSCVKGYKLVTDSTGSQSCQQEKKTCGNKQYLMGQNCYNYVANCADFQSNSATCNNCQAGYALVNNTCIQAVNKITCPLGQSAVNGVCTVIDKFCIFYNQDNTCMLCAKGYSYTGGSCSKIICGPRQSSSTGNCVDVSPFCNNFDPIYGNCFTCIQFYFLQIDGTCLQAVPGQVGSSQIASDSPIKNQNSACPNGYYERQGTCVQVSPLCGTYDSTSGQCTSCVNDSYYLFPSGKCVLISTYCGYRTYFSNGNCLPVSNFCDQFDNTNGKCITCRDGSTLNSDNRCVYSVSCEQRQYRASDGTCTKVSSKCGDYDPETGQCLTCIANFELNDGGACCYAFNYLLDPNCVKFYKKNCATQRPQFNNCLKCNTGYTLSNGVFGRCNAAVSNNSTSN